MSALGTMAKLAAMASDGDFDRLSGPLGALLDTLATYPAASSTPRIDTREQLIDRMTRHAVIDRALRDAVALLAALPLWSSTNDEDALADDLAENCLAGLESWSADLAELIGHHPRYDADAAAEASRSAKALLAEAAALTPPTSSTEGADLPEAPEVGGLSSRACPCGAPAAEMWGEIAVCSGCASVARMFSGGGR